MTDCCHKCQNPLTGWLHNCVGFTTVIDPVVYRESVDERASNPLDRLSFGDVVAIYEGADEADAVFRRAEEHIAESNARYFNEPLAYRFEFESISPVLGFRPMVDRSAILTEGRADGDWERVLDFINAKPSIVFMLVSEDETFLCRLVPITARDISTYGVSRNSRIRKGQVDVFGVELRSRVLPPSLAVAAGTSASGRQATKRNGAN